MLRPLLFTGPSARQLHLLLLALLFLTFLPSVRSGLGASENHCLNLSGTCRRDICRSVEDEIGGCRRRWKCCRIWWVLLPIPTPVVMSDYQEALKHKVK
ncbi:putative beta-defensin 109B [Echinops telfairi]|uniref:Beta-defensin 109B n=1 Tax=Echinops telfairi TaxID=9371 RepID=A0ABM1VIU6_ECHTE|nr:putative beta-defensin 109B [Echinops telfairi]